MKRWPWLLALGLAAFAVFALVTLPARVVLSRLHSSGVAASGVTGSIWNGSAQVLIVNGVRVGAVEWRLHVLPLFTGRFTADVRVKRVDGFAEAEATAALSGRVSLQDLTGSLPISMLPPNIAGGWAGTANMKFASLVLENGWPVTAEGSLDAIDVTGPAGRPRNIGSYKAVFPPDAADGDALRANITDLGGPLQVNAVLQLKQADRSYVLEGMIAARPDAPREIADVIQFLGPPDAQGRRSFSLAGTM